MSKTIDLETGIRRKRVLLVSAGSLSRAGVQMFLQNWISHMNTEEYEFIWYFTGTIEDEEFAKGFVRKNVILYAGDKARCKSKIQVHGSLFKDIMKLSEEYSIDVIHVNTGSLIVQADALLAARIRKVPVRIAHSHNNANETGIRIIFSAFLRRIILHNANCYAACSKTAAEWLFGKRKAHKAVIINNCIDVKAFAFSKAVRMQYREKLGLSSSFVVGHVGRFNMQKNHKFLIEIFKQIVLKDDSAKLLLVGGGELEADVRAQVITYGLEDKVIFAGVTDHVKDYMCAMDVFVLPSIYEGLGIVNIEAQVNGLPCVVSDNVAKEAAITDKIEFLQLKSGIKYWADIIWSFNKEKDFQEREQAYLKLMNSEYDINYLSRYISILYR